MGMTDFQIAEKYAPILSNALSDLPQGSKVAWLGQKHPKYGKDTVIYDPVVNIVKRDDLVHHFYDIANESGENCFNWDVHDRWQISGYDLVLGIRVLYLCESRSLMIRNITETAKNNKKLVFDFMSGNPRVEGDTVFFEKKEGSKSIMPMLTQFWPEGTRYLAKASHEDQTVYMGDFTRIQGAYEETNKVKLELDNLLTFRDSVKNRFYSLCEIRKWW